MDKKELHKIALSFDPIMNFPFDAKGTRSRKWLLMKPHKADDILGKCIAQPITLIRGGFGVGTPEHILVSDRNIISLSEKIYDTADESFIRKILTHEINHSKQSAKYMDAYKKR